MHNALLSHSRRIDNRHSLGFCLLFSFSFFLFRRSAFIVIILCF